MVAAARERKKFGYKVGCQLGVFTLRSDGLKVLSSAN